MPFARFLVSYRDLTNPSEDAYTNTLYFNISSPPVGGPDYNQLCQDIATLYGSQSWTGSRTITVTAYDMDDAKPRPVKGKYTRAATGSGVSISVSQVALCLSYYADRNLPRQRGRIYTGPWGSVAGGRPTTATMTAVKDFGIALGDIGGLNVDWSLYSPTNGTHTRINNVWVDNSWDVIRSRKWPTTARVTGTLNG